MKARQSHLRLAKANPSYLGLLRLAAAAILGIGLLGSTVNGAEVKGPQSGRWNVAGNPYLVVGDVIVPSGLTLTIESGVIVKFAGSYSLKIEGTLMAVGGVTERIIFTSVHDNEFGANGFASRTAPSPQDWKGIEFVGAGDQLSKLEHCIIRYSERAISAKFSRPSLLHIIVADCSVKNLLVNGKALPVQDGLEYNYSDEVAAAPSAPASSSNGGNVSRPAASPSTDELSFGEMTTAEVAPKPVARVASAAETISASVVAALVVKLMAFEKNTGGASGDLTIYVMGAPEVAEELKKAVGMSIGNAMLKNVIAGDGLPKTKPSALYIGDETQADEAIQYCRINRILSLTAIEKLSAKGVTLGIGVNDDGKPKVILNLTASAAEGLYWNAAIMKFATTIK